MSADTKPDPRSSANLAHSTIDSSWLGRVPYLDTLAKMGEWQASRKAGTMPDTFFYLEHEPVITAGRASEPDDLQRKPHNIPVVEVARGGKATYHGPGQLIGYGIIDLSPRPDLEAYIRAIEEALIAYLQLDHQLAAIVRPGHTGVWIDAPIPRKIASIGISARRWVTGHGFALNVMPDLTPFDSIIPCGMPDVHMTSVLNESMLLGDTLIPLLLREISDAVHIHLTDALRRRGYGCFA